MTYQYLDRSSTLIGGGSPSQKLIGFDFWNQTLVAYNYISNFAGDSSDFDDSKMSVLAKGRTTKNETIDLLGPPTGRAVYPALPDRRGEKFIYQYVEIRARQNQRFIKRLEIVFGGNGRIVDYRFASDTSPLPSQPAPAPTVVPIIVPRGR